MAHVEGTQPQGAPDGMDAALWRALEGVVLPLSRAQLVHVARENEASMAVLTRLAALPDGRFRMREELRRALSPAEAPRHP
jgi:hypothetical protein